MFDYGALVGGILNQEAYYNQAMGMQQAQGLVQLVNYGAGSLNNDAEHAYQMAKIRAQASLVGMANAQSIPKVDKPKEKSMFKEVVGDVKGFVLEHRSVIYFIVAALMIDHFFFKGAFKMRLQGMADKVVTKVEEKIK